MNYYFSDPLQLYVHNSKLTILYERTKRVIYIGFVYILFNWKEDKQHTRIKKKVVNKLRFNFNSIQQQKRKKLQFFNGKNIYIENQAN